MILVTGATGTVGGHLIRELCQAGAPVRALVRTPERADALRGYDCAVAIGDYADADSLAAALQGVDRVFLVSRAGPDQPRLEGNVIDAVRANAPDAHVVKLASSGVDQRPTGARIIAGHQQIVDHLGASGLRHTVLAATTFMQNLINSAATIQQGALYSTVGDAAVSHVDARDVAAVAAHVLTTEGHEGATYTITGPEALTYAQVAERISAATGRQVSCINISEESRRGALEAAGLSAWLIDGLIEFNRMEAEGETALVTDEVTKATGRPARDIDDFLGMHHAVFA